MSTTHTALPPEAHLGQALSILQGILPGLEKSPRRDELQAALRQTVAVIQQVLPHLGDTTKLGDIQAALHKAAAHIEAATVALEQNPVAPASAPANGELLAVISAAVAVVLDQPYRIVDVQRTAPVVTWINAWALEGRFQHYSSRRIR